MRASRSYRLCDGPTSSKGLLDDKFEECRQGRVSSEFAVGQHVSKRAADLVYVGRVFRVHQLLDNPSLG